MALLLDKNEQSCSSSHSTLSVLFTPLLFLHLANLELFSIVEEVIQKVIFLKPYYHADVAADPDPISRALK